MRVAVLACAGCGKALDPEELIWCPVCIPRCENCGVTDHEQGPIHPVTGECVVCFAEYQVSDVHA